MGTLPNGLVHAISSHHLGRDLCCPLQVIGRTGRDLVVKDQSSAAMPPMCCLAGVMQI
jgi:hypothetical protein